MRSLNALTLGAAIALVFAANSARAQDTSPSPQDLPVDQPGVTILPAPMQVQPMAPTAPPEVQTIAPPPVAPGPQGPPTHRVHQWYGYQTLIVDAAVLTAGSIGYSIGDPTLSTVGTVGYFVGGPVVHWGHGFVGKGFGDFGIRCAFPLGGLLVGAIFGAIVAPHDNSEAESNTIVVGLAAGTVAGVIGAMAFDAAVFAEETVVVGPDEARARQAEKPNFTLAPKFHVGKNLTTFGLGGTF